MADDSLGRRSLLAVGAAGLVALAGCPTSTSDSDPASGTPTDLTESPATSSDGAASVAATATQTAPGTGTPALDLREANVTGVSLEARDGDYRFSVELYHDDDGEDGYANWWQVETVDGERLGRRELLHAHSTAPFTRSETIAIPSDVTCVVVRGHDQTHGYGGQAMLVAVPSGDSRAVTQGSDRRAFADADCP